MRKRYHKRVRKFANLVDIVVSAVLGELDNFVSRSNQSTRQGFLLRLDFSDVANRAVGKDDIRWYRDELTERLESALEDYSNLMFVNRNSFDLSGWPVNAMNRILNIRQKSDTVEIVLHFKLSKIKRLSQEDFKKLENNIERELIFLELHK